MCVCVWGGGGGTGTLCLTLHCHHQNDFCSKIGSDESHFNTSLVVRDKIIRLFLFLLWLAPTEASDSSLGMGTRQCP